MKRSRKALVFLIVGLLVLLSICNLCSVIWGAVDKPTTVGSRCIKDGDYTSGVVSKSGGILLDITHATHPNNVYDYKTFFPDLKELELNFTEIYVTQTLYDVNGSTEVRLELSNYTAFLGFEVGYVGQEGRLGVNVMFPDNTTEEVFDDNIYNGNRWQFHYHNASEGNWTLTIFTTQAANITLIAGESEGWNANILNGSDVLILCSPYQSYTPVESDLALAYASAGGSLLLSGEPGASIWGANLNPLIKPLGIQLNGILLDPTNNTGEVFQPILANFTDHPVAVRAQDLGIEEIIVRGGGALNISNPDVKVVLKGDSDTTALPLYPEGSYPPFAATLMYEEGKIFIQGDSSPGQRAWYQAIYEWFQEPVLDTGPFADPYPSIAGIHNGTITPFFDINVSKMYTYPCPGTGGHTEYVKLWDNTGWNMTATWNGYSGDWHNITFNESFTLYAGTTYNYTIRTGSYPQIIHEREFSATGGTITCTSFEDANGNVYTDWIPAIRLY
jgi:hypothetical protein